MAEIHQALREIDSGKTRPVWVFVGNETLLIERAVTALKATTVGANAIPGFNEDLLQGDRCDAEDIINAARTMPMMAERRFVLVRRADVLKATNQAALAGYLADPSPDTCLVLVAHKLDGNGKLSRAAKKAGARFDAKPLKGSAVRDLAMAEADRLGHPLAPDAAHALVDAVGDDLSALADGLERLSLYVGPGQRIDVDAVEVCVSRVRVDTVWQLVDAISLRDTRKATAAAASLLANREPPLRILMLVARQLRIVARMRGALARGLRGPDATKAAGAPPFKARALTEAARRFKLHDLEGAFAAIAQTDLSLKGSKEPGDVALQRLVLDLCNVPGNRRPG